MSQLSIRRALEQRLDAMSPAMATAWENAPFTPTVGTPYQRANLLPATPDNQIQGAAAYLARGIFQVTLCYPTGVGSADAETRAEAVRAQFKRGTTMTEAGINVIVMATPRTAPALIDGDRYLIPISVTYQAQIAT